MIWKVMVAEWANDPLVPAIVTVYDPVVVPVQERVEVADPPLAGVTFVGFRPQVKPVEGDIVSVNATALLNPFRLDTVIVEVPAFPAFMATEVGLALSVKSGAAPTTYVTFAECDNEPLAPVTWTV